MKLEATVEETNDDEGRDAEFIVIVDRSGSMQGKPWSQVQSALIKMLELTRTDSRINVRSIAYNHSSSFLNLTGDIKIDSKTIKDIRATGNDIILPRYILLYNIFIYIPIFVILKVLPTLCLCSKLSVRCSGARIMTTPSPTSSSS